MRKVGKRWWALAAAAVLMCQTTALGATPEEAQAYLEQVMTQTNSSMDDINAFYDLDIGISGDMLTELGIDPITMRMEMNLKANHLLDPSQLKYMAYYRITDQTGEQMTGTMYLTDGYMYSDTLGTKTKMKMEAGTDLNVELLPTDLNDMSMDMIKDVSIRQEGEDTVVSYSMDAAKFNQFMMDFMGLTGMEAEFADAGITMSFGNLDGEYVLNSQGQLIKIRMDIAMDMGISGENLHITMKGDVGIADPGQPVEVPMPNPAEYTEIQ